MKTNVRGMNGLAISPDGRWVGLGRGDRKITVWELASGKEVLAIDGHDSGVRDVTFTRDGRGIIGNADLCMVLWSLTPKDLPAADGPADELWTNLASDDGGKAYRLQWALVRTPKTAMALFQEKVKPAELVADRSRFDKLVTNLDSPQFRTREAAERELTQSGLKLPRVWVQKALADAKSDSRGRGWAAYWPSARSRTRVSGGWRASCRRCELIGTEDARALLKTWAASEGSTLAIDAKAALARLGAGNIVTFSRRSRGSTGYNRMRLQGLAT